MTERATDAAPGRTNWAGNLAYHAEHVHAPASLERLQEIVRRSERIKVLGSGHSFNDIADTTGDLVSLRGMPRVFDLDHAARTVRVDGGVRYGELCARLDAAGFALHNLASLPHISVAGACATATHGSGDRSGNLATAVSALEVVVADGETVLLSRDREPETFEGVVVSLGAIGVVTAITLDLQPAFRMSQEVFEDLSFTRAAGHFDEITARADSVSLFTGWRGPTFEQVWLKRRVGAEDAGSEPAAELFGATRARAPLHPIPHMPADACTEQLGVPGPWYERMPHFRMDHTPSSGAELQSEYLVPRRHAVEALLALDRIRDRFARLVQVSEIRTVASDRLWLSTAAGRASVAIHFTWHPDGAAVRSVLPAIETALAPYHPRPHWGKMSTMPPDAIRASYPDLPRFLDLVDRFDPAGKFRNAFLGRILLAG